MVNYHHDNDALPPPPTNDEREEGNRLVRELWEEEGRRALAEEEGRYAFHAAQEPGRSGAVWCGRNTESDEDWDRFYGPVGGW